MAQYASMFSRSSRLWSEIRAFASYFDTTDLPRRGDPTNAQDERLAIHPVDYEAQVHCFYPEKLIRFGMTDALVVDSDLAFHIMRR